MRIARVADRVQAVFLIVLVLATFLAVSAPCRARDGVATSRAARAVQRVLEADRDLGTARNHAPESGTLADAIREYVAALEALDFRQCPDDFTDAFRQHVAAWKNSIPFFDQHGEIRGEMHDAFEVVRNKGDAVREKLEAHEEQIWGTWAEVEAAATKALGSNGDEPAPDTADLPPDADDAEAVAGAAEPELEPELEPETLRGKTIRWTFENGPLANVEFEHVLHEDGSLDWRALNGSGMAAHEKSYATRRVTPGVHVVSYLGASGYTLTVVLALETGRMMGFASNQTEWVPLEGTFRLVR